MDQRAVHQLESQSVYMDSGVVEDQSQRELPQIPEQIEASGPSQGIATPSYVQIVAPPDTSRNPKPQIMAAVSGSVSTPKFNGKQDIRAWLIAFRFACEAYNFNQEQMFAQLYYSLESPYSEWFVAERIDAETRSTTFDWSNFQGKIINLVEGEGDSVKTKLKLLQMKQEPKQSWLDYWHRKRLLLEAHAQLFTNVDKLISLWDGLDQSVKNKTEKRAISYIQKQDATIEGLYAIIREKQKQELSSSAKQTIPVNPNRKPANEDQLNQLMKKVDRVLSVQNQKKELSDQRKAEIAKARDENLCFECGEKGHRFRECPKRQTVPKN